MKWFPSLFRALCGASQCEVGLIGGSGPGATNPYIAQVDNAATLTQIQDVATNVSVSAVAINNNGLGLVGKINYYNGPMFVDWIYPNSAVLTPIQGLPYGIIESVAVNELGVGLIGGQNQESVIVPGYAAFLYSNGQAPIPMSNLPSFGTIYSVALNRSGFGLIGGQYVILTAIPYAAVLQPNNSTPMPMSNLPHFGVINSVSMNDSGVGLIGGQDQSTMHPPAYVARVEANSSIAVSIQQLPVGEILSVAINQEGMGLVGGQVSPGPAYAAWIYPESAIPLEIQGLPVQGMINSVAINDAGVGLIGGQDLTIPEPAYAAWIYPNQTTPILILNLPASGVIDSVAVNNAGIGLLGGQDSTGSGPAFAALVAPNGSVTRLSGGGLPLSFASINSVSLMNTFSPRSVGPYSSVFNTQLSANFALESHLITDHALKMQGVVFPENLALLVHRGDVPRFSSRREHKYSLWIEPFGDFVIQKKEGNLFPFKNAIFGVLAGFESFISDFLWGGGFGYALNHMHSEENREKGKIQEEMAVIYGAYQLSCVWLNGALFGGGYQFHNQRSFLSTVSRGSTHGWVLSPHVEAACSVTGLQNDVFSMESFLAFDWVYSWQKHYTEKGKSGFNLVMKDQNGSLFRSEFGFRFYEIWKFDCGKLLFEEKMSYVHQTPCVSQQTSTVFVSSVSTFPIAIGSSKMQNLGGVEFKTSFLPVRSKFYGSLDFQGEFGATFQSYFTSFELGRYF